MNETHKRIMTLAETHIWEEALTKALRAELLRAHLPLCHQALQRTVAQLLAAQSQCEEKGGYVQHD